MPQLTPPEFRAWHGFLQAHDAICKALDARLRREFGRGFEANLTVEGRDRLRRVHASHIRAVRELFVSHVTPEEQKFLAAVWDRLKQPSTVVDSVDTGA